MGEAVTGYHITLGYRSGYSYRGSEDMAWDELKKIVSQLRLYPAAIVDEVNAVNPHFEDHVILEIAQLYSVDQDATIRILEEEREIMQLASGGDYYRDAKEEVRRAFSRLVIREAHKLGIEVNLKVV